MQQDLQSQPIQFTVLKKPAAPNVEASPGKTAMPSNSSPIRISASDTQASNPAPRNIKFYLPPRSANPIQQSQQNATVLTYSTTRPVPPLLSSHSLPTSSPNVRPILRAPSAGPAWNNVPVPHVYKGQIATTTIRPPLAGRDGPTSTGVANAQSVLHKVRYPHTINNQPFRIIQGDYAPLGRNAKRPFMTLDNEPDYKRRRGERGTGLRLFAMRVCEKVREKRVTTYNEVADELVEEYQDPNAKTIQDQNYDQKNIRRRVYDALNVLMAMNICGKEKKEIRWQGLPTNSRTECSNLEMEKRRRLDRIREKTEQLHQLILQHLSLKNLISRNEEIEKKNGRPPTQSIIHLPFVLVSTATKTVIDCSISNDKTEYLFNFDNVFEVHDDTEIFERMGLSRGLSTGHVTDEDLAKCQSLIPRALEDHVLVMAKRKPSVLQTYMQRKSSSSNSPHKSRDRSVIQTSVSRSGGPVFKYVRAAAVPGGGGQSQSSFAPSPLSQSEHFYSYRHIENGGSSPYSREVMYVGRVPQQRLPTLPSSQQYNVQGSTYRPTVRPPRFLAQPPSTSASDTVLLHSSSFTDESSGGASTSDSRDSISIGGGPGGDSFNADDLDASFNESDTVIDVEEVELDETAEDEERDTGDDETKNDSSME